MPSSLVVGYLTESSLVQSRQRGQNRIQNSRVGCDRHPKNCPDSRFVATFLKECGRFSAGYPTVGDGAVVEVWVVADAAVVLLLC